MEFGNLEKAMDPSFESIYPMFGSSDSDRDNLVSKPGCLSARVTHEETEKSWNQTLESFMATMQKWISGLDKGTLITLEEEMCKIGEEFRTEQRKREVERERQFQEMLRQQEEEKFQEMQCQQKEENYRLTKEAFEEMEKASDINQETGETDQKKLDRSDWKTSLEVETGLGGLDLPESEPSSEKAIESKEINVPHDSIQEDWKLEAEPTEEVIELAEITAGESLSPAQPGKEPKKPFGVSNESFHGSDLLGQHGKTTDFMVVEVKDSVKGVGSLAKDLLVGSLSKQFLDGSSLMGCTVLHRGRPPEYRVVLFYRERRLKVRMASRWKSCHYQRKRRSHTTKRTSPEVEASLEKTAEAAQIHKELGLVEADLKKSDPKSVDLPGCEPSSEKAVAVILRNSLVERSKPMLIVERLLLLHQVLRVLDSGKGFVKEKVCVALQALTFSKKNARAIVSCGGVSSLLENCQAVTPDSQAFAASVLRNLAISSKIRENFVEENEFLASFISYGNSHHGDLNAPHGDSLEELMGEACLVPNLVMRRTTECECWVVIESTANAVATHRHVMVVPAKMVGEVDRGNDFLDGRSLLGYEIRHRGRPPEFDEESMDSFQKDYFFFETHYKVDYEDPSRHHCSLPIGQEISHCGRPPEFDEEKEMQELKEAGERLVLTSLRKKPPVSNSKHDFVASSSKLKNRKIKIGEREEEKSRREEREEEMEKEALIALEKEFNGVEKGVGSESSKREKIKRSEDMKPNPKRGEGRVVQVGSSAKNFESFNMSWKFEVDYLVPLQFYELLCYVANQRIFRIYRNSKTAADVIAFSVVLFCISGIDRPCLLSEACAVLVDLRCNVVNAKLWTPNARAVDIVHVTNDSTGVLLVECNFSVVRQLRDASFDDEGLLEVTSEKKSKWPTRSEDMEKFRKMVLNEVRPNGVKLSSILPGCVELRTLSLRREVHGFVVKHGMGENLIVCSTFIPYHRQWGVLTFHGKETFAMMVALMVALVGPIGASIERMEFGMFWNSLRCKRVKDKKESLVRSKCIWRINGKVEIAQLLVDKMAAKDLVFEKPLILRYVHNGCGSDTLEFLNLMQGLRGKDQIEVATGTKHKGIG